MTSSVSRERSRCVTFHPDIVETSIGGSQRHCPMRRSASPISSCSEESSLSDMDRAFFHSSPQEPPVPRRQVRSYPFPLISQETDTQTKRSVKPCKEETDDRSGVTVAVRVRPFTKRELNEEDVHCVITMTDEETAVRTDSGQNLTFSYDHSLWSFDRNTNTYADQQYTYEAIARPLLLKAVKGYNACLFAYGQTSSGKSHSIMGSDDQPGIIPRFAEELFTKIEHIQTQSEVKVNVEISFFEIYNEKIRDLLTTNSDGKLMKRLNLKVREHPVTGPYVEGLCVHVIDCHQDLENWLSLGNKQRATASTGMNEKSSRSHSVFTITLTQTKTETFEGELHEHAITSRINLIDLAGSERQSTAKTSGERLKEGASINRSLLTLGKVISQLCDLGTCVDTKKRKVYIPYRDSVLTWLLKESLGGNSQTSMLATISPANICVDETISTLRYASQARCIVNTARINEDPKARLIRELRAEIDKLRALMTGSLTDDESHASSLAEIASLKNRLSEKEQAMKLMTRSWEERLEASEQKMREESNYLEKSGIALKMSRNLPYLVNLNEDPLLSETLVYVLQPGCTRIGQVSHDVELDIQLTGALIAPEHCTVHNDQKSVRIEPILDSLVYINGNQIYDVTELQHGDRVILGGDHYFRFHHPLSQTSVQRSAPSNTVTDFQFAKDELSQVQNAKMEEELAEVRKATVLEMEKQKEELENQAQLRLEETKREADEKLTLQKNSYEERLKEMNEKLKVKEIDSRLAEEVKLRACHLEKENEYLQQEVEIYKKEVIADDYQAPVIEEDYLDEIESIKNHVNAECSRLSELRHSAKRSALTPARRRPTPYRARSDHVKPDDTTPDRSFMNESRTEPAFQLYEVVLMIREANQISQFLGKGTEFYREVMGEGGVCIRVSRPALGISTFWSVEKLSQRLLRMREMYEGVETDDDDDVDPFYDSSDAWEQDDRISSSAVLHKRIKAIRRSLSPQVPVAKRLSFSDDQSSPLLTNQPVKSDQDAMFNLCKESLLSSVENYREKDRSIMDMILIDLQRMLGHFEALDSGGGEWYKLVSLFQSLTGRVQCWREVNRASSMIDIYDEKLDDLIQKLCSQLSLLVQGCQSRITAMISESVKESISVSYQLAKLCGEFSLASHSEVRQCFFDKDCLSKALLTAFLSGSDLFVDKTLKGALTNVEECEFRIQTLRDTPSSQAGFDRVHEQTELLISSVRVLLSTIHECQVTVETVSVNGEVDWSWYGHTYQRHSDLVLEVTNLSEQVRLLLQISLHQRNEELDRLLRCSELLDKITGRLIVKSGMDTEYRNTEYDSSNDDRIHTAGQEIRLSVQQLIQTVKPIIRTLPSPRASPAKFRETRNNAPATVCRNLAVCNF